MSNNKRNKYRIEHRRRINNLQHPKEVILKKEEKKDSWFGHTDEEEIQIMEDLYFGDKWKPVYDREPFPMNPYNISGFF